jgi:hypothetical protein
VCPWKEVTQQEKAGHGTGQSSRVSLAHVDWGAAAGEWAAGLRGTRLVMRGGDHCAPIGAGRRVEILFFCAAEDRLLAVEEYETCTAAARASHMSCNGEEEEAQLRPPPALHESPGANSEANAAGAD